MQIRNIGIAFAACLTAMLATAETGAAGCPPAKGFDAAGSDERAVEIADEVMDAMGGCDAWQATRYLSWNFFGRRTHFWDRWTGDIRVESGDGVVVMNLNTGKGKAWRNGAEVKDATALADALETARAQWINDSYWLFMPYKLKDTGVTLHYVGEGTTAEGAPAHILELTFDDVGVTPENKYRVYVNPASNLVVQWDYFEHASDEEPAISTPWRNWEYHGAILLSGDRGEGREIEDIKVYDELPEGVFTSP